MLLSPIKFPSFPTNTNVLMPRSGSKLPVHSLWVGPYRTPDYKKKLLRVLPAEESWMLSFHHCSLLYLSIKDIDILLLQSLDLNSGHLQTKQALYRQTTPSIWWCTLRKFSFSFSFGLCGCLCVIYAHECRCPRRPEAFTELKGGYKTPSPNVGL